MSATPPNVEPKPMRLPIDKTYKLFIKGEFVRSESGRSLPIALSTSGVTNVARASRKDARDAVTSSKAAQATWAGKTAYLRGQVLYRLAEVMEGRRVELAEARRAAGKSAEAAQREVDAAIDRTLHYAGWSDKIHALLASLNPVAGPHYNVSHPEPTGIVAVIAPDGDDALLGLVSAVLPVIVSGNAALVVGPERDPRATIVWCECIATSDLPPGVINVLTGLRPELVPHLARHMDVQALDLWRGPTLDAALAKQAAELAAANVKRVKVRDGEKVDWYDDAAAQGLSMVEPWLELKTVWHPVGL